MSDFLSHILVAREPTVPTVYHTPLTQNKNPPKNGPKVGPPEILGVKMGSTPPETLFFTISPPEGVQKRVRCLTRGFLGC